jgi:hypothetical protein
VQEQPTLLSPRRRLWIWRSVANFMVLYVVPAILLGNLVWLVWPSLDRDIITVLLIPFGIAMVAMAIPSFLSHCGFMFGLIKCPDCHQRYAHGSRLYFKSICESCGADMRSLPDVVTSNNSLQADRER